MRSMLQFAMHYGATPMPTIDLAALLDDKEENLRPQQINVTHASIMELLGNPGNPLYAKPHSMAEHFDALIAGAHAIGECIARMVTQQRECMMRKLRKFGRFYVVWT